MLHSAVSGKIFPFEEVCTYLTKMLVLGDCRSDDPPDDGAGSEDKPEVDHPENDSEDGDHENTGKEQNENDDDDDDTDIDSLKSIDLDLCLAASPLSESQSNLISDGVADKEEKETSSDENEST